MFLGLFSTSSYDVLNGKEHPELAVQNDDGLELKISLSKNESTKDSMRLSLSAQYIIVNQTSMTLQIQSENHYNSQKASGQIFSAASGEDGKPFIMFSHPRSANLRNRVRLRVADSDWSEPFSLEAVGVEFELKCKSLLTLRWYNLGGFVSLGQEKVV